MTNTYYRKTGEILFVQLYKRLVFFSVEQRKDLEFQIGSVLTFHAETGVSVEGTESSLILLLDHLDFQTMTSGIELKYTKRQRMFFPSV